VICRYCGSRIKPEEWARPAASLQPQASTNGLAITSMIMGLLGISPLALIFGYVAKGQIRASGGLQAGGGMATAGIVLGWLGLAWFVAWILVVALV